jgi:hypothetical protein
MAELAKLAGAFIAVGRLLRDPKSEALASDRKPLSAVGRGWNARMPQN